jgi:hypothetical protein
VAALVGAGSGHSLAHHLWTWLEDAGGEYGVAIEPAT